VNLLQFKLRPLSAWRTAWQADTLTGLLCWTVARLGERDLLEDGITAPALRGKPPFVLSDAFPGDLLPVPIMAQLQSWPDEQRKVVKRARWLTKESFIRARNYGSFRIEDFLPDDAFVVQDRLRNTLDCATQGTPERGGLWPSSETWLAREQPFLSVYARVADEFAPTLIRLVRELTATGFGADTSAGLGQFELLGKPETVAWLDESSATAKGCMMLSTFQPAVNDPTDGLWESFVKYGKLGPDFGLENDQIFKRPLLMLRPGACFVTSTLRPFLGRAIPMDELLPEGVASIIRAQKRQVVHFAFGLAVPFHHHE
jgi:CRISPR-associated protein Csm4